MGARAKTVRTAVTSVAVTGALAAGTMAFVDSLVWDVPESERRHVIIRGRLPDDHAGHDMSGHEGHDTSGGGDPERTRADAELVVTAGPGPNFSLSSTALSPEVTEDGVVSTWVINMDPYHDFAAGDPDEVAEHSRAMRAGESHDEMDTTGIAVAELTEGFRGMIDIPVAPAVGDIAIDCAVHPGMTATLQLTGRG